MGDNIVSRKVDLYISSFFIVVVLYETSLIIKNW